MDWPSVRWSIVCAFSPSWPDCWCNQHDQRRQNPTDEIISFWLENWGRTPLLPRQMLCTTEHQIETGNHQMISWIHVHWSSWTISDPWTNQKKLLVAWYVHLHERTISLAVLHASKWRLTHTLQSTPLWLHHPTIKMSMTQLIPTIFISTLMMQQLLIWLGNWSITNNFPTSSFYQSTIMSTPPTPVLISLSVFFLVLSTLTTHSFLHHHPNSSWWQTNFGHLLTIH